MALDHHAFSMSNWLISVTIDPKHYLKVGMDGPHMGAAIFRSPEAMMQLRWGQSSDIWSFGTTVGDAKQA